MCIYFYSCSLCTVALTSVDKESFLKMLFGKSANEKSVIKEKVKVNHFFILCCTLQHLHVVSYFMASLKCSDQLSKISHVCTPTKVNYWSRLYIAILNN